MRCLQGRPDRSSRLHEDVGQRQPKLIERDHLKEAQRRTTQREWIARSCRALADREECGERIQPVGDIDRKRYRIRWSFVALPRRLVMVAHRVGDDPATGKTMTLREGRFGPYVTDGETNASLKRGDDPETVTIERAAELLADRRSKGPAPKRKRAGGKRSAA